MIWKKVTEKQFDMAFDFLMENELPGIAVLNRLRAAGNGELYRFPGRKNGYLVAGSEGSRIKAVCLISPNGLLLPVFSGQVELADTEGLLRFAKINRLTVNTIMGMKNSVERFAGIPDKPAKDKIDYFYMVNDYRHILKKKNDNPGPKGILIRQCSARDCDKLFELHREYELEEVLLDRTTFRQDLSYMMFRHLLSTEIVYMLACGDEIAAKCNSNAKSPNYMQIGGMYTKPAYRNMGYGTMVLQKLMLHAALQKKHSCLFVKMTNKEALGLYKKNGFETVDEYTIIYW
ncbi:MAG: GNAT family N-acetyltransferase [Spirochaetales bacterium]|nr:GNAT family N-acetyltransferase [Spirochaetales bacterium]